MEFNDDFIKVDDIDLHYISYGDTSKPTLILMHGLTANAHAFDGLVSHGLAQHFRVVSPDLRGRGLSSKPACDYTMEEHTQDILGLLNHLEIEQALLGGHSFGGLLTAFMASCQSDRVSKAVILDAAIEMNPNTPAMLGPTLARLDTTYESYDAYIEQMKAMPHNQPWDADADSYFKADANIRADGTVNPYPNLTNIIAAATSVAKVDWATIFKTVQQPALLVNGLDDYTMEQPLLPDFKAKETAELMPDCKYVAVDGNHHTMLYGANATKVVAAINSFLL